MPELSINDIQKMTIADADGAVTLVKEDETWRVSERSAYAADFAKGVRDPSFKFPRPRSCVQ